MDYNNGRIYIIRNTVNDKVYIGSTTQSLTKRFYIHKSSKMVKRNLIRPFYKAMREIGEEHFYIELIENYPCKSKEELNAREGYWIRQYNSFTNGYNGKIEGRSKKQWEQDNAEEIRDKKKSIIKRTLTKLKTRLKNIVKVILKQ